MPRVWIKLLLLCSASFPAYAVDAAVTKSLSEAVALLRSSGYSIIYSSEVERQAGQLNLDEITIASLQQALKKTGLELRRINDVWVVGFFQETDNRTVKGSVVTPANNPIVNAKVVIKGRDDGAVSNPDGQFFLENVPNDAILEVSAKGFHGKAVIADTADLEAITLVPEQWIENIIITGSYYRFPFQSDTASLFNLSSEEINLIPSLGSDAVRVVNRLPGTSSLGVSAKPHIRGGLQDEVLIIMDGVELLEPFHLADFHQGYSSIDSRTIESLDIYTGGFPARYGNRMSGVMAINTDRELPEFPHELGWSVFSRFANTQGQTSGSHALQWMASVREGDLEELTEFMEPRVGNPEYFDAFGRVAISVNEDTELSAGSIIARDDNAFLDDEESASSSVDSYYYWGKVKSRVSEELQTTLIFTAVNIDRQKQELSFEEDGKAGFVDYRQDVERYLLQNDYSLKMDGNLYEFGFEFAWANAEYRFSGEYDRGELAPLLGIQQMDEASVELEPKGWSGGSYFVADLQLSKQWSMQPSMRLDWQDYYFSSSRFQVSPRIAVNYEKSEALSFWLSLGRFYQPQGINELQVLDGETAYFKPQRSDQVIIGLNWQKSKAKVRAEYYYKRYRDQKRRYENLFNPFVLLPEIEPDRIGLQPDKAFARGFDMEFRYNFNESLSSLLRYSYMDANDQINGVWVPRRWSQKNTINALISWQKDDLNISAALTWHSGWRSTFLPASIPAESAVVVEQVLNNIELKDYLSLDISASKSWRLGAAQITLYGDVSNVLERDNISGVDFEVDEQDDIVYFIPESEQLIPLIASVGIVLAF